MYCLPVSGLVEIPWDDLRARARKATEKSYSPYSHVRVGAAGVTDDGRLIEGSNVENASYGLTLCAECALVGDLARSGGGRLIAVSVVAGDGSADSAVRALPPASLRARGRRPAGRRGRRRRADHAGRAAAGRLRARRPRHAGHHVSLSAVDVISTKRDGGILSDEAINWFLDAYQRDEVAEEQMSALLMAIFFQRALRRRAEHLDRAHDRLGRAPRPVRTVAPDRRQALDRRRRRQGLDHPGATGGRVRRRGAPAVGSRPRSHRRHAGQARIDPGVARQPEQRRRPSPARGRRRGHLRGRGRARAHRPAPLRAARRDRDGRVHPPDLLVDHVQEDRRGHGRPGARRQGRARRLHEGPRERAGPGHDDGRARRASRCGDRGAADGHGQRRWGAPRATPWRSANPSRCCAAAGPRDVRELTLALARRCSTSSGWMPIPRPSWTTGRPTASTGA